MMFAQSITLGLVALLFPKFVSNIDYLYYGMGIVILAVFVFYFIALPKYSAEAAEVDVQQSLKADSENMRILSNKGKRCALFIRKRRIFIINICISTLKSIIYI